MTDQVEWAKLTGPEIRAVAANKDALAVLPIGSLEQHGPHLPVITDTASASAAAIRAARLVAGDMPVLVLPGLWTGMSEHHLPFGGTISLNYTELSGVLRGVVRSLRAIGFARLLIVNGHGGNVEPLARRANWRTSSACRWWLARPGTWPAPPWPKSPRPRKPRRMPARARPRS
jgi:creatinine amidohydrolase